MNDEVSQPSAPTTVPAGWYPDGNNPNLLRYWDGSNWTPHTHPVAPAQVSGGALKKSIKLWVALLVLPIPIFITSLILQIGARFLFSDSDALVRVVNVISILINMGAVLMLLGLPIWVIMIIKNSSKH